MLSEVTTNVSNIADMFSATLATRNYLISTGPFGTLTKTRSQIGTSSFAQPYGDC